jgi:hypothetical protein
LVVLTFVLVACSETRAQSVHVSVGKLPSIPPACESVLPAEIEGRLDIPALGREANCKGAGDMLIEYTYVMEYTSHSKDKKGNEQSETRVFEVYIPTLKSGTRAPGVLIMTSRNGVPIPPEKMEKVRREAGEQLEKEENRIAKQKTVEPAVTQQPIVGMKPLGMYPRTTSSRSTFGFNRSGITLDVHTVLEQSTLAYLGREDIDGRENLIFSFVPNPGAQLDAFENYVARLRGKLWIDAKDRIVTRLAGWPASTMAKDTATLAPAVYIEMSLLPDGNWMPHESRVLASEYPELFDGIRWDAVVKYSEYQRFKAESKDVEVESPKIAPKVPPKAPPKDPPKEP